MPRIILTQETRDYNAYWLYGAHHRRVIAGVDLGPVRITLEYITVLDGQDSGFGPRPVRVEGIVIPAPVGPRDTPESSSGFSTSELRDVDDGHLMALNNGGPQTEENIVPQWAHWQRSEEWRNMERDIKEAAQAVMDATRYEDPANRRYVKYEVDVEYVPFSLDLLPRFTVWSFPRAFYVTAYVCNSAGVMTAPPTYVFGRRLNETYNRRKFSGNPDDWHV